MDMEALDETVSNGSATVPTALFPEGTPSTTRTSTFSRARSRRGPAPVRRARRGGQAGLVHDHQRRRRLQQQVDRRADPAGRLRQLEVEVTPLDGSTVALALFSGEFDMAVYRFGGLDPEPAFASRIAPPTPSRSRAWGGAEIDAAIQEGQQATDLEGRKAAYDKLGEAVNEVYRYVWMNVNFAWTVESSVRDRHRRPTGGHPAVRELRARRLTLGPFPLLAAGFAAVTKDSRIRETVEHRPGLDMIGAGPCDGWTSATGGFLGTADVPDG